MTGHSGSRHPARGGLSRLIYAERRARAGHVQAGRQVGESLLNWRNRLSLAVWAHWRKACFLTGTVCLFSGGAVGCFGRQDPPGVERGAASGSAESLVGSRDWELELLENGDAQGAAAAAAPGS